MGTGGDKVGGMGERWRLEKEKKKDEKGGKDNLKRLSLDWLPQGSKEGLKILRISLVKIYCAKEMWLP